MKLRFLYAWFDVSLQVHLPNIGVLTGVCYNKGFTMLIKLALLGIVIVGGTLFLLSQMNRRVNRVSSVNTTPSRSHFIIHALNNNNNRPSNDVNEIVQNKVLKEGVSNNAPSVQTEKSPNFNFQQDPNPLPGKKEDRLRNDELPKIDFQQDSLPGEDNSDFSNPSTTTVPSFVVPILTNRSSDAFSQYEANSDLRGLELRLPNIDEDKNDVEKDKEVKENSTQSGLEYLPPSREFQLPKA